VDELNTAEIYIIYLLIYLPFDVPTVLSSPYETRLKLRVAPELPMRE
jgi:hypothetical protein